jgi:hypothetical protein
MKTSELTGAALDWTVAKCEGLKVGFNHKKEPCYFKDTGWDSNDDFPIEKYSADWAQGGPIIDREKFAFGTRGEEILAFNDKVALLGPTYLIAAMRCYVASKLGDEVEIPEELCK